MVSIYGIEDINDNIYVGSTKQKLNRRLDGHRERKRNNIYCSSSKLNLDYCIIYELEKCEEKDRKEREAYWIEKLQSVNDLKLNFDKKEYKKQHWTNNKEEFNRKKREIYKKNKDVINQRNKDYYLKNKEQIREQQRQYRRKKKQENTK